MRALHENCGACPAQQNPLSDSFNPTFLNFEIFEYFSDWISHHHYGDVCKFSNFSNFKIDFSTKFQMQYYNGTFKSCDIVLIFVWQVQMMSLIVENLGILRHSSITVEDIVAPPWTNSSQTHGAIHH